MISKGILILSLLTFVSALNWPGDIVFEDNFNGNKLDETKWMYDVGCSDVFGPDNLQCYNKDNIEVKNGKLIITAKKQKQEDKDYTSGRIRQIMEVDPYGAFVVNARLARGDHLWPAIWLINKATGCRYEEIDIAEYRGQASRRNNLEQTGHWGRSHDALTSIWNESTIPFDLSNDFHEYAVLWTQSHLMWFVDDHKYYQVSLSDPRWTKDTNKVACDYTKDSPPFSDPEHFVLNLGVGGEFFKGLNFDPSTWSKPTMEVDWVRVYKEQGVRELPSNNAGPPFASINQLSSSDQGTMMDKEIEKMKEFIPTG